MANIELKIVALGDFSSVNAQIKALQTQVELLQKSVSGVGLKPEIANQLKNIQSEFSNALMSSGNFTKQTVQLTSETQKFGQALQSGKLSLGQYFGIITGKSAEAQKAVNALAVEQVKLNNSIVQTDITKQGVYSVYTPTKIDELSKSTEIAAAKQNIYNLAVKEGSTQLINFGKNTQWAGRQLTVGLAMPAILFGSQAVAAFKSVNTELTRLQRLYGEGLTPPSQAQLNQISGQVLKLGTQIAQQMGIAQSETVKVAANFAAMGIQGQNLLNITTQTQRLSKLGAIDATQATAAIVSLQNVYKVSTQDLGNAVNFLSSMQKQTTMSLSDMTDAIPRVGPIMAQLGGTYKDTAVMLLAMKEAGVPAAQAANALKSAMASIIAPTSAATKEFASFGINLATIKNAGTPVQMIEALQSSLVRLAPLAREQLIEKLFGKFQFARVSALLDNFGKVGSQTQNALKVAGATNAQLATLAGQEMAQATQSTTAKWQRAIETLKADLYPIGQKILEVGTKIIDFGQKIADFFNKLPGPIKSGLGILLTLGVISGPIIMITGLLANLMGQGMKVGYSLLGIIDGTKKWKDLMTPTSIAAKTATDAFNEGIMTNVASIDQLNAALLIMIDNLAKINMGQMTSAGGVLGSVEKAAAAELASGQLLLPGMATGGFVPGNPSDGDAYPAMLMGGEAVIPTKTAEQHRPLINAMLRGNLPGYAFGIGKVGKWKDKKVTTERGHGLSEYPESTVEQFNEPGLLSQTGLDKVVSVVRGMMLGMFGNINQGTKSTRSGKTGSEIAEGYRAVQSADIDPLENLKNQAKLLGVNMKEFEPKIDKAFEEFLNELETTKANYRFGGEKAKERAIKEGQIYGGTLESFTESKMGPTIDTTATSGKSSLGNILKRIAGTRGSGRGKTSGSTGNTFFEETPGKFVPISESEELKSYPELSKLSNSELQNEFATRQSYSMKNLFTRQSSRSKAAQEAKVAGEEVVKSGNEGLGNNSPSVKGEESGVNYIKGVEKGINKEAPSLWTEGKQIASTMHDGIDEGLNGSAGTSKIQGIFNKAFGSGGKLSGMMSKFSGMGMIGKMGIGMGLGAVSQMASPLLNKLPGGNLISDALSGASMGAGFGPWGMAAGAALTLVGGGIKSLMAAEKLHSQESAADFKVSSDAIQFFGGKVSDTSHQMDTFTLSSKLMGDSLSPSGSAGKGLSYSISQLKSFSDLVKSLSKDNPLPLVIDQMKGLSGTSAKSIADSFIQVQMAINGMSKSQADSMLQMMLTMSGHSSTAIGAGVSAADQLHAIQNTLIATRSDRDKFTAFVGQISNLATNTTSWQQYDTIIKAIGSDAKNSGAYVQGLISYLNGIGDKAGALTVETLQALNYSATEITDIQKILTTGSFNTDKYKPSDIKAIHDLAKKSTDLQLKATNSQNSLNNATNIAAAASQANSAALTKEQKLLDAKLKSLQDLQKQQTQNTSYATTQEDLKNQILMAQSTGDNLKAQMLKQQLLGTTRDYKLQNQVDAAQQAADANRLLLDNANANSTAQIAATNATTAAVTAGAKEVANAIHPGSLTGSGAKTALGDVDVGTKFGMTTGEVNKNVDAWHKAGTSKIPEFKGQWAMSYTDPETGKQSQVLTPDARAYVVKYGNEGQGYKKGDEFQFNGYNYKVTNGVDSTNPLTRQGADLQGSGSSFTPSSSQIQTKKNSIKYSDEDLKGWLQQYNTSVASAGGPINKWSMSDIIKSGKLTTNGGILALLESGLTPGAYFTLDGKEYQMNNGGANVVKMAKGGVARTNSSITYHKQHMNRQARHFDTGGHITGPGTAISDSIPAMLSNGEYVIKADSVAHYGKGFFDSVNAKKFAKGGMPNVLKFTEASKYDPSKASVWSKFIHNLTGYEKTATNFMMPGSSMMVGDAPDALANILGGDAKWNDYTDLGVNLLPYAGKATEALKGAKLIEGLGSKVNNYKSFIADTEGLIHRSNSLLDSSNLKFSDKAGAIGPGTYFSPKEAVGGYAAYGNFGYSPTLSNSFKLKAFLKNYRYTSLDEFIQKSGKLEAPFSRYDENDLKVVNNLIKKGIVGIKASAKDPYYLKQGDSGWSTGTSPGNPNFDINGNIFGEVTNWLLGKDKGLGLKNVFSPIDKSLFDKAKKIEKNNIINDIRARIDLRKPPIPRELGLANGGMIKLPSFATGTSFVPHDMIAQIHKGEAVVPAHLNNGTMGNTYNITVNAGSNASPADIAKEVMNTIKRTQAMSGRKTRVGQ